MDGRFYMGVKTGFNRAFVIDKATRQRLIEENPRSAELIKPWLRGRDVKRWRVDWQGLYVIFTYHGVNIERYPALRAYLEPFRERLEQRRSWAEEDYAGLASSFAAAHMASMLSPRMVATRWWELATM